MEIKHFSKTLTNYVGDIGCLDNEDGYCGSHKIVSTINIEIDNDDVIFIQDWYIDEDGNLVFNTTEDTRYENLRKFYLDFHPFIEDNCSDNIVLVNYNNKQYTLHDFDIGTLGGCGCWVDITLICV